jgi:hypothetical protein
MAIIALAATTTTLLLTGSAPSHIGHRVYLLQLSYVISAEPPIVPPGAWENITLPAFEAVKNMASAVRVSYFGICVMPGGSSWVCHNIVADLETSCPSVDRLGMTIMAAKVKNEILFPGFL